MWANCCLNWRQSYLRCNLQIAATSNPRLKFKRGFFCFHAPFFKVTSRPLLLDSVYASDYQTPLLNPAFSACPTLPPINASRGIAFQSLTSLQSDSLLLLVRYCTADLLARLLRFAIDLKWDAPKRSIFGKYGFFKPWASLAVERPAAKEPTGSPWASPTE